LVLRSSVKVLAATSLVLAVFFSSAGLAAPVPSKLRAALKSSSSRVRIAAVVAVSKSGADDARPLVESMLEDSEDIVRAAAVEGLERLKDPAALPAVEKLLKDKSDLIRKVARRAWRLLKVEQKKKAKPTPAPTGGLVVDVGDVRNSTGKSLNGAEARLREKITNALRADGRKAFDIRNGGVTKGYGLLLKLKGLVPFEQDNVRGVQIDCDMTVVELPGKSLRMNSSASTGAGTTGKLTPKREAALVLDAIDACAPELARDFVDYVLKRGS
jgi:hypothetical protein